MRTRADSVDRPKSRAILFTDIVGSTQYFIQHGDHAAIRMLERHNQALFPVIEQANGRIVKTIGDSIFAIFIEMTDALLAAAALQRRMEELRRSVLAEERIHIRIGVHYGLVSERERDVFGDSVNLAERIKSAAEADQILVSRTLRDLSRANRSLVFETVGVFDLKGHAEPMELFALLEAPKLGPRTLIRRFHATRRRYARYYAVGAFALLLVGFVALEIPSVRERVSGALFGPTEKHIAVLPFDNIGNDPANQAMAEGLMDSMTGQLSNLDVDQKMLWVVPASVVRARKIDDPKGALKQFGATLVVTGSVLRSGQNIQLTVNLINTRTLRQIGSVPRSTDTGDLESLENDALAGLGRMLNIPISIEKHSGSSNSPVSYDLYIEALGYMQRYDKPGNLNLAISRLKTATAQDSSFALAFAVEAEAYRLKYKLDKNAKWLDLALAACGKAIRINPQLPRVFVTLGRIHDATGKPDLAVAEFQQALAIDGKNAEAIGGLAGVYDNTGRLSEAEQAFKKAASLRPDDWDGYNSLALFYESHGRFDEGIAELKRAIELSPDNPQIYANLGAFYLDKGDKKHFPEAESALQRSLELAPTYQAYGNLGLLYLYLGRYAESVAANEKAVSLNNMDFLPWAYLEAGYRAIGKKAEADAALQKVAGLAENQVHLNPANFEAQSWLGLALARQDNTLQATRHIEAALALAPPDNQTVLINAIEAYNSLGEKQAMLRLMKQAHDRGISLHELTVDPAMQATLMKMKFSVN